MSADITIDGTTIQDVAVRLKGGVTTAEVVEELGAINSGQKVTVLTGYDQSDM